MCSKAPSPQFQITTGCLQENNLHSFQITKQMQNFNKIRVGLLIVLLMHVRRRVPQEENGPPGGANLSYSREVSCGNPSQQEKPSSTTTWMEHHGGQNTVIFTQRSCASPQDFSGCTQNENVALLPFVSSRCCTQPDGMETLLAWSHCFLKSLKEPY
ncbi:uncharacterized protein GJ701_004243 [Geothlypis trichas]